MAILPCKAVPNRREVDTAFGTLNRLYHDVDTLSRPETKTSCLLAIYELATRAKDKSVQLYGHLDGHSREEGFRPWINQWS